MSLFKQVRVTLLSFLGYILYQIFIVTFRWKIIDIDTAKIEQRRKQGGIVAFWHNQQIFMPYLWTLRGQNPKDIKGSVIISQHGDGRIIAGVIGYLGLSSIDGSSTRGGREALKRGITHLQQGYHLAITPDGPRGPIYKSKPGVVKLAQASGVPITPCALYAEKKWTARSWDKMFLPKPFSRVVIAMGEDIHVPSELSENEFEEFQKKVDKALHELNERCEEVLKSSEE